MVLFPLLDNIKSMPQSAVCLFVSIFIIRGNSVGEIEYPWIKLYHCFPLFVYKRKERFPWDILLFWFCYWLDKQKKKKNKIKTRYLLSKKDKYQFLYGASITGRAVLLRTRKTSVSNIIKDLHKSWFLSCVKEWIMIDQSVKMFSLCRDMAESPITGDPNPYAFL